MATLTLKIFISSPGDVGQERLTATRVIERLQGEFRGVVRLETILWEHQPLRATEHFQEQLNPSDADIVVCIFWSRLGSRLPDQFRRPDGSTYASGTEWEVEEAERSFRRCGRPVLLAYRKTEEPKVSLSDEKLLLEQLQQKKALDAFIERWLGSAQTTFRRAFHEFKFPENFEDLLETHLRPLIRARLPKHLTEEREGGAPTGYYRGSPYRGLAVFDVEDADIFFGRRRAIREITNALTHQAREGRAFVLVFGMSGEGKSSLVRAGVLPTITQPGVIEGIGVWRWCIFRPSGAAEDLFAGLARGLYGPEVLPELEAVGMGPGELATLLRDSPRGAVSILGAALKRAAQAVAAKERLPQPPEARLALVLDQFEELFTLESVDAPCREKFVAAVSALARSGWVWVISTMRCDFFHRCGEIPELVSLKDGAGQYHLLPPTFAEIHQMITEPARAAGLRFEVDSFTEERLDDALHAAAAAHPEALPLLEFTLNELYNQRTPDGVLTFAAYRQLGGLEGALARRAEEEFAALAPDVQQGLPTLLRALVTAGDGDDLGYVAARRVPLQNLATSPASKALLNQLIGARLLSIDRGNDGTVVVGLVHEALLRHWPRLQQWLMADREFLRVRGRVGESAERWEAEGRSPDYLLQEGKPLAEAEELLDGRRAELEPSTITFVEASKRRRGRIHRTRRQLGAAIISVLTVLTIYSSIERNKAEYHKDVVVKTVVHLSNDLPASLEGISPSMRSPVLKATIAANQYLLERLPHGWDWNHLRAVNAELEGTLYLIRGQPKAALAPLKVALETGRELVRHRRTVADLRNLAVYCGRYADALKDLGEVTAGQQDPYEQALKLYEESREITASLVEQTHELEDRKNLCYRYGQIADVQSELPGHAREAATNYERALAAARDLPSNDLDVQHYLMAIHEGRGDVLLDWGKSAEALAAYEESLRVATELVQRTKSDADRLSRDGIAEKLTELRQKLGRSKLSLADVPGWKASLASARECGGAMLPRSIR